MEYNTKIIVSCENITKKNINELYHQISRKTSPYEATVKIKILKECKVIENE